MKMTFDIRNLVKSEFPLDNLVKITPVEGGYICNSYICNFLNNNIFVKLLNFQESDIFYSEIEGLNEMKNLNILAPKPYKVLQSANDNISLLFLEYLNMIPTKDYYALAQSLANFHANIFNLDIYGFKKPGYNGKSYQPNKWNSVWPEFYFSEKLQPLIEKLNKQDISSAIIFDNHQVVKLKKICNKILPKYPPSTLLHGDLWIGNTGQLVSTLELVYFDPSCFYGHNEFDLATLTAFSEEAVLFPKDFYKVYFENYGTTMANYSPQEVGEIPEGFEKRIKFYHLFVMMNQWIHFGDEYKPKVLGLLDEINEYL